MWKKHLATRIYRCFLKKLYILCVPTFSSPILFSLPSDGSHLHHSTKRALIELPGAPHIEKDNGLFNRSAAFDKVGKLPNSWITFFLSVQIHSYITGVSVSIYFNVFSYYSFLYIRVLQDWVLSPLLFIICAHNSNDLISFYACKYHIIWLWNSNLCFQPFLHSHFKFSIYKIEFDSHSPCLVPPLLVSMQLNANSSKAKTFLYVFITVT